MYLRDVVRLIKVPKWANIIYVAESNQDSEYIFFRYAGSQEEDDLNNNRWRLEIKYNKNEIGVYIRDTTVDEFIKKERERKLVYSDIIGMISENYPNVLILQEEISLYFTVFCILHEIGHVKYFNGMNMNTKEYAEKEIRDREKLRVLEQDYKNIQDKYSKYQMEYKILQTYKSIPSEAYANQYALKVIMKNIEYVKKQIGL